MKKLVTVSMFFLLVISGQASAVDVWYDVAMYWDGFASIWYEAAQ